MKQLVVGCGLEERDILHGSIEHVKDESSGRQARASGQGCLPMAIERLQEAYRR